MGGFEEADLSELRGRDGGLKEIRSGVWRGIVVINLSGDAPALAEVLAPMIEVYADYESSIMTMAFDSEDEGGLHRFPPKRTGNSCGGTMLPMPITRISCM